MLGFKSSSGQLICSVETFLTNNLMLSVFHLMQHLSTRGKCGPLWPVNEINCHSWTLSNFIFHCIPKLHKFILFNRKISQRGRRGQEDIVSDVWLRDPGFKSRAHLLKDTETYIPLNACRLQWATIRCGKHVHADYMPLNMILTAISHAVSTVRRVSRSAVYYTHQTNSLPLSKP